MTLNDLQKQLQIVFKRKEIQNKDSKEGTFEYKKHYPQKGFLTCNFFFTSLFLNTRIAARKKSPQASNWSHEMTEYNCDQQQ